MSPEDAILTIALLAAFADDVNDEREREHLRRTAESLGAESHDLARLYQDVLLKRVTLADAVQAISDIGQRQLAYEMAVCVCNADGETCAAEKRFLSQLRSELALEWDASSSHAACMAAEADIEEAVPATGQTQASPADARPANSRGPASDAELNAVILKYAILNGALELLPQSWASVAIIPLQVKLVHHVGTLHGYALDKGHIREFLATVGVGMSSQYLEQFARKLFGGLLRSVAGKGIGRIGSATTGIAFSFATTYALGHIARDYYAGGRQMSTDLLRARFQQLLQAARQLQGRYLSQIEGQAANLDAGQIMAMVKGPV